MIVTIISWLIFGLIVGSIVHVFDRGSVQGGVMGTILTGVIGALFGGFLSYILLGITTNGFNLLSLIISVFGALLFVVIERIVFRNDTMGGGYSNYGFKGGKSRMKRLDED